MPPAPNLNPPASSVAAAPCGLRPSRNSSVRYRRSKQDGSTFILTLIWVIDDGDVEADLENTMAQAERPPT